MERNLQDCFSNGDLDYSLHSLLTSELHHACSVVLFCSPYLCVHLHLTVIRAQLASFQQKRAKGDIAGTSKKTQKRKGQAGTQIHSTTQDCPVKPDSCQAGDPNLSKPSHEVCNTLGLLLLHKNLVYYLVMAGYSFTFLYFSLLCLEGSACDLHTS